MFEVNVKNVTEEQDQLRFGVLIGISTIEGVRVCFLELFYLFVPYCYGRNLVLGE